MSGGGRRGGVLAGVSARRLAALERPGRARAGPSWGRAVAALRGGRPRAGAWASGVVELCDGLAAELVAGRTPEDALAGAVAALPSPLREALAGVPAASDVPEALRERADRPGADGLRLLAACWSIGVERGAAFAPVLDGLASGLRDERAHRAAIRSQLAGARTTARLLAVLPAFGLAMSWSLGANPLVFLFTTLPGALCLLSSLTLNTLGLLWTSRIATTAESP
ncbi:type II secretion system F family protein [Actinocorallia sp. API 0066]|uniref:type II secretion system F family protein n=1 Tax=Actinocorallia sp. API 0066 TaxID=2896846 RepID=UPI001E30780B|nr:type II secretion system F family protein [Actinocorallia sp. API 0066]MCD0450621.1 type II secretion system F family protein [Actinocorallia sp. API 0066]